MYAIIRTGGKQYKVEAGDLVRVEKLEQQLGTEVDLNEVLFIGGTENHVGKPLVENAKVTAVVTQQGKAAKIIVFKKKRRQGYRRTQGHRQRFTELFIKCITAPGGEQSKAHSEAKIVDPEKKAERMARLAEVSASAKKAGAKPVKQAAVKKKTVAKKKAATKKKVAAKKKVTKKKVTKKVAKKKTAKTTKKKS
jgi:large subunit ribosomal protein L21